MTTRRQPRLRQPPRRRTSLNLKLVIRVLRLNRDADFARRITRGNNGFKALFPRLLNNSYEKVVSGQWSVVSKKPTHNARSAFSFVVVMPRIMLAHLMRRVKFCGSAA